jgi:hypothetical protein
MRNITNLNVNIYPQQSGKHNTRAALFAFLSPLTPELNPSAQRYLTRFLLGILLLEPCNFVNIHMRENQQTHQ